MNIFLTSANKNAEQICQLLAKEHLVEASKSINGDPVQSLERYKNIYTKIKNADIFIAEVSNLASDLGYQISYALEQRKPVVLLYTTDSKPRLYKKLSSFSSKDNIQLIEYNKTDLATKLRTALDLSLTEIHKRFTILLPPNIINFLNQVSTQKNIPKSVYIRQLIEERMR